MRLKQAFEACFGDGGRCFNQNANHAMAAWKTPRRTATFRILSGSPRTNCRRSKRSPSSLQRLLQVIERAQGLPLDSNQHIAGSQ